MEESILNSTKENLGLPADYTPFDLTVITLVNSTLSSLAQLGIGPPAGITIEDDSVVWDDLGIDQNILNMAKTYVFLKVKLRFDPPDTGFHVQAMKEEIDEQEWRLQQAAEALIPLPVVNPTRPVNLSLPKEDPVWG